MSRLAGIILGAVVALAALPTHALDGYSSPMVVPAAAFHIEGEDSSAFFFHPDGYLQGDGSPVIMYAAVYLPQYATVESVTLHAVDGSDSCTAEPSVIAVLNRSSIASYSIYQLSLVSTTGASSAMQSPTDSNIDVATIDNMLYRYYLRVGLCSASHHFYSVEINYTE